MGRHRQACGARSPTTLTNLNGSGVGYAVQGHPYTTTLPKQAGMNDYGLPETITVSVCGTTLTVNSGYTYDANSRLVAVDAGALTGVITISAVGVQDGMKLSAQGQDMLAALDLGTITYGTTTGAQTVTAGSLCFSRAGKSRLDLTAFFRYTGAVKRRTDSS